jgi:hypothetical protein
MALIDVFIIESIISGEGPGLQWLYAVVPAVFKSESSGLGFRRGRLLTLDAGSSPARRHNFKTIMSHFKFLLWHESDLASFILQLQVSLKKWGGIGSLPD